MNRVINTQPLTAKGFAPFGDILDASGTPDKMINQGRCGRFNDLALLDVTDGKAGISIFKSEIASLPLKLDKMERHPMGSQAFVPMSSDPFLVVVAADGAGTPQTPLAFLPKPGQAINIHRGIWHGVLTPLAGSGLFAVIDRIGDGPNLDEHWFDEPYLIENT